jgi:NDP-sugar pyrophosphorylase family protein
MVPLLILAGGRATRLAAFSSDRPKFLAPIDEDRCFADVQLAWVREQGFRQVILSVGYRADMIRDHVGDGRRHGVEVRYAEDGPTPLGTGGAVQRALAAAPEAVAVLYGDTVLELDCRAVLEAARDAVALMTVMVAPAGQPANATLEGDLVRYDKQAPQPDWRHIDYGLSVLSARFLEALPRAVPFDLAVPLAATARRGELKGFLATRPFHEINTPEALAAFRLRFARKGASPS